MVMEGVHEGDLGSSSNPVKEFIPQVVIEKTPKLGQEFDSVEQAQSFYNEYARSAGFSVRNHSSKKNKIGEIIRKEFVCYKEGVRDYEKSKSNGVRKRPETREGCKAKFTVVKRPETREGSSKQCFVVSQFNEIHNHVFATPRKVHFLRSHRSFSSAKKALSQQFSAANVPVHQQISIFELQSGGLENIGCIERDIYNARRDEREQYAGHDAQMLIEYFQAEKGKNYGFFFSFEMDSENKVRHCFWADAECRRSYHAFGDVVVFDTTYNTNRYGMIFAPFVGVNHHGQSTLLACAFLSDETAETFSWLLQQLLLAMPSGAPKMIITDQDPAMTRAIAETFPNTIHRLCMWHILSKFSEKLDAVKLKEHYPLFQDCIWNSEDADEFEVAWFRVLEISGMSDNEWLKGLYVIRRKWIPAYVNGTFSAGMSSSQRAESCHAFFKQFVSKKNSLMDFVVRFERALKHQRHQELCLDHKDVNEQPVMKTMWPLEKKMSGVYTHNIFYKFQDELYQSMAYVVVVVQEEGDMCIYNVHRAERSEGRVRKVVKDKSNDYANCSCKKFESAGILCRHVLATFSRIQLQQALCSNYVLPRWTTAAKSSISLDFGGEGCLGSSQVEDDNELRRLASNVIDDAYMSRECFELVKETLESLQQKIKSMTSTQGTQSEPSVRISEPIYNEPDLVRAKGCGKRLKGGKEIETKKSRRCHGCGLTGQSHDKRNCPALSNA